jgi:glycerophosphoryl diester phosphodiesterase
MTSPWPYPFWIAHRGAGRAAPENTLAAFRAGLAAGFRMFECDVKLSADGVPFLLHDTELERTTSGHGLAGDQPWAALSQLDAGAWHGPAFAGEPLPTLAALARCLCANGANANLEIKPTPGTERETGARVAAQAAALWAGQPAPPLLSSFSVEALEAARDAVPALPRALLLERLDDGWAEAAAALGAVAVVFHAPLANAGHIAALHAAGRRALCYTVNDEAEAERLRGAGIDGLITDAIERFGSRARA